MAATSPPKPPAPNATAPASDPVPATAPAPVPIDTSSPPLESPQPSPAGGSGWNKAKTGGVAAGGSIAVVGALLLLSKVTSFSFLDASVYRQIKEAGKRLLQPVLQPSTALREVLAKARDGKLLTTTSRYPVFEGGDAKEFIQQYELFARKHKMQGNLLSHVEVYLDPTTREWYRSKLASGEIPDWKAFVDEFQKEFGLVEETYEQVMEELENFQQGVDESIDDYVRRALEFVSRLDRVNPCQQQQGQVSNNEKYVQLRFLAGLRPNLREKVKAGVKGVKGLNWDVLQAVAKAVSFDTVELAALGSVAKATAEQTVVELGAVALDAGRSITKEILEELPAISLSEANMVKEQYLQLREGVQAVASTLKTELVGLDAPKIEEVSLDVADKVEAQQSAAQVQSTEMQVQSMPVPPTGAAEIERLSSTVALLQAQLLEVQQQQQIRRAQDDESRRSRARATMVCYNCRERGHYRSQCPKRPGNA